MNTIEEDNRLIAEFMGDIDSLDAKVSFKRSVPVRLFKYHSDWNWLMEVVEKIESLDYDFRILGGCWIIIDDVDPDRDNEEILEVSSETKIKSVYDACVAFINWYNENK